MASGYHTGQHSKFSHQKNMRNTQNCAFSLWGLTEAINLCAEAINLCAEGVIVPKTKADTLAGRLDTKLSCELAGSGAAALSQYAWNFAHFGTENTMSWEAHRCGADWNHWSLWLVPLPKRGGSGSRNTHWLSGG